MEEEVYNKILKTIRNHQGLSKDCLELLNTIFTDISPDALHSIVSNEYQKRMKYFYVKTPQAVEKYYNLYTEAVESGQSPGVIVKMAADTGICPCLIAKLILQKPFLDDSVLNQGVFKISSEVKSYIRDTNLIPNPRLAYEVYLCTLYDDLYSPTVEIMKTSVGQEYEIKLQREMARLGLTFRDEEHLRKYGYDKTPDIKLEIPVAINGFIINWVESKARFADEEIHREYFRSQYASYWNSYVFQDDEEQWISSEELCTEGSSDEETRAQTTGQRRLKKNTKPQKRGISPLAQSSKKDETISPDVNDSNYLLPEIPVSKNATEPKNQSKSIKPVEVNLPNSSNDSEESLDASEIETMIQWRPKRGSIKLPELCEGIPAVELTSVDSLHKTEEHSLFEMNAFFMEMNLTIRNLKLKHTKYESILFPELDVNEDINLRTFTNIKKNENISSMIDSVNELDDLISEKSFTLEKATEERKAIQQELYNMIMNQFNSKSVLNKSMQTFLELCRFEINSDADDKDEENSTTETDKVNKLTKIDKEKGVINRTKTNTSDDESKRNYFKLNDDEISVMQSLDSQLQKILQSYNEENLDAHNNINNHQEDVLEAADKEGKYWKHEQIRKRLEKIQKNLNQITLKDEEDQMKLKEIRETFDNAPDV
ncbi:hypothetical protein FQR65_LT00792 [Abscondita terminalis]|nr:hypothetical protein FQR65_LT00792 [Abscondita terminalis]